MEGSARLLCSWCQHRALSRQVLNHFRHFKNFRRYLSTLVTESNKWIQPEGHDSGIAIYHPQLKQKVPLILKGDKLAQWYACGPTVYASTHIGHASSYVRIDIIRRILTKVFNIDTTLVLGMTDIDDKIINKSKEMNVPIDSLTKVYEAEFFADMTSLNVLPPTIVTRVTEYMPQIIRFIKALEKKNLAYKANDASVYFDVKKYGRYGQFTVQRDEAVDGQENVKRNSHDFALWKAVKPGEPSWDSPWGPGRPGWHIECSAMASDIFGANFDVHSGGEDLMFPHHENEMAQSCAFHGNQQWANYWLHTGHLFVSGQTDKMSKSLNNVISVPEFLASYSANHFRMLCLLNNYKKRIEFNEERMQKAVSVCRSIIGLSQRCSEYVQGKGDCGNVPEAELFEKLHFTRQVVEKAFADDFNTPQALAHVMRLVRFTNQLLQDDTNKTDQSVSVRSNAPVAAVGVYIQRLMEQLGMDVGSKKIEIHSEGEVHFDKLVDSVVEARAKIRNFAKDKNRMLQVAAKHDIPEKTAKSLMKSLYQPLWQASDAIRQDIQDVANIQINDAADHSTWTRQESKRKPGVPKDQLVQGKPAEKTER